GSAAGWLRRILMNLAVDRARRHSRELPVEEVEDIWRDDAYSVDSEEVVERSKVTRCKAVLETVH
ncbi:MAG: hypothetical protein LC790_18750, partial [Actinobacteria bacterium]|nr:hypothetical protein [Actinomycetota bacterium]